jgi:hypothetical protein
VNVKNLDKINDLTIFGALLVCPSTPEKDQTMPTAADFDFNADVISAPSRWDDPDVHKREYAAGDVEGCIDRLADRLKAQAAMPMRSPADVAESQRRFTVITERLDDLASRRWG